MKVISFSLYGDDPVYRYGAVANAMAARQFFPEWQCRFHVSSEIPAALQDDLRALGAVCLERRRLARHDGTFWRFLPASDPSVSYVISRDVDAILCARNRFAVDRFMASGKAFHVIRDHPGHRAPILAGLWGYRADSGLLRGMRELIEAWGQFERRGCDQDFLAQVVYPIVEKDLLVHSDFVAYNDEDCAPIGFPRVPALTWLGMPCCREEILARRIASFSKAGERGLQRLSLPLG